MWDTAGQERFRSVTSTYYRGAMGAIICYDCVSRNNFQTLETWITEFRNKNANNSPIIIV